MTPADVEADRKLDAMIGYTEADLSADIEDAVYTGERPDLTDYEVCLPLDLARRIRARIAEMEAQWAAQDDAWCDRVEVLSSALTAATERAERAEAELREACMQSLADMGQAQDAYDAQLKAEARAERLRAALELVAGFSGSYNMPFPETDPGYGAFAVVKSREAIAADTQEADHE